MTILTDLDATREETLRYFGLGATDLARCYGAGKWSVAQVLHHLADSELVLLERISRVLSEGRRVLWAFDQELWAGTLHEGRPLQLSRDVFAAARGLTSHYARCFYESHGHLEWVHSESGVRSLRQEFDKVASHNEGHLAQIRAAIAP